MKHSYVAVMLLVFGYTHGQTQGTTTPIHGKTTKATTPQSAGTDNKMAEVVKAIESKMIQIDAGSFTMGCVNAQDSECYYWEKPRHTVSISTFFMCKYPVTQKEWKALMGTTPYAKNCAECPVEMISWYDVQIFINKLNQVSGKNYRLPTEAEWEYAAKGGNKSRGYKFPGGNVITNVAWYDSNSLAVIHPVGQKQPNELGLYDMGGDVWQWCSDWFNDKYYSNSPSNNPQGPPTGESYRVVRGGSWWGPANDCRTANRDRYPPDAKDDDVGFRLVHN